MSNYPRDEFDNIPESSSRQGVHRTAMDAPRPGLWPIVSFAVVALLVGAAAFLIVPKLIGGTPEASGSSASRTASASSTNKTSSTDEPSGTVPTSSTALPSPTSATPSTPPSTPAAAPLDKSQPVNVYNGTLVTGLSARVAQQVRADGWTVALSANWQGIAQPNSVIFYNGAVQKTNAEALGQLLGISRLVDTADLGIPLAVVLGPGAQ